MCALYLGGIVIGIWRHCLPQDTVSRGCGSVCHGTAELPSAGVKNVMQLLWEKQKTFYRKRLRLFSLQRSVSGFAEI